MKKRYHHPWEWLRRWRNRHQPVAIFFHFTDPKSGIVYTGESPMSLIMTDVQHVSATLSGVDAKGNPASFSGVPTWQVSDPTILAVTPAADGLSADIAAVGALGTAQVSVTDGTLTGVGSIQVNGDAATSLNLTFGTPAAIPPAAPASPPSAS